MKRYVKFLFSAVILIGACGMVATSCMEGDEDLIKPQSRSRSGVGAYTITVTETTGGLATAEICACEMEDDCDCCGCVEEGLCQGVEEKSRVLLKAVAEEGYVFRRWVVSDEYGILSSTSEYEKVEFDMPAVDVVVRAEFEAI